MVEEKKVEKKQITVDKWKKKKWFKIHASEEFDKKIIGETPAEKPKLLENRTIRISLADLINQRLKRHIIVEFVIKEVQGQDSFTQISGHNIIPSYIDRMVRRRNSKMETVQIVTTKDNKKISIKAVAISSKKLSSEQETAIRKIMLEKIEKAITKKPFSQTIQEIIFGVIAAKIFKDAKKIAPLKRVEITKTQIIQSI